MVCVSTAHATGERSHVVDHLAGDGLPHGSAVSPCPHPGRIDTLHETVFEIASHSTAIAERRVAVSSKTFFAPRRGDHHLAAHSGASAPRRHVKNALPYAGPSSRRHSQGRAITQGFIALREAALEKSST